MATVVTILTSLVKNVDWSAKAKNSLAVVGSAIAGTVYVLASNHWDFASLANKDVLALAGSIYGVATVIYGFILKGTPANAALEDIRVFGKKA